MNPLALSRPVGALVEEVVAAGRRRRRVWVRQGRAHIEVRAADRPEKQGFLAALEEELERLDGVNWAEVNAVTGRVVVAFESDSVGVDDLVGTVEDVEEAHGASGARFPHERPEHPGDVEGLQRGFVAIGADVVGIGVSAVVALARMTTPIPGEIAGVLSFAESQPRVRSFLEARFGDPVVDTALALGNAVAHGLGAGPFGLVVDIAHRTTLLREGEARRRAWLRREPELHAARSTEPAVAFERKSRPVPLPSGPIERLGDRAALASVGAFGVALAVTRDPRRAAGMLLAGMPKAGRLGRDAFGAQLGRALAERDVVVMDPAVLRRLDRIDTVVVDGPLLTDGTGGGELARALVAAVHGCGHELVITGPARVPDAQLEPDRRVEATDLVEVVRSLQSEGRAVALISADARAGAALAAADCGVGLAGPGRVPWGADLVCGPGLETPLFVVAATRSARRVSRQCARLAVAGSTMGGLWGMAGPRGATARRTLIAVNAAALVAVGFGAWSGAGWSRWRAPAAAEPPDDGSPLAIHPDRVTTTAR